MTGQSLVSPGTPAMLRGPHPPAVGLRGAPSSPSDKSQGAESLLWDAWGLVSVWGRLGVACGPGMCHPTFRSAEDTTAPESPRVGGSSVQPSLTTFTITFCYF